MQSDLKRQSPKLYSSLGGKRLVARKMYKGRQFCLWEKEKI